MCTCYKTAVLQIFLFGIYFLYFYLVEIANDVIPYTYLNSIPTSLFSPDAIPVVFGTIVPVVLLGLAAGLIWTNYRYSIIYTILIWPCG